MNAAEVVAAVDDLTADLSLVDYQALCVELADVFRVEAAAAAETLARRADVEGR